MSYSSFGSSSSSGGYGSSSSYGGASEAQAYVYPARDILTRRNVTSYHTQTGVRSNSSLDNKLWSNSNVQLYRYVFNIYFTCFFVLETLKTNVFALQDAIHKLTVDCWDKCVTSTTSEMGGREETCVANCVGRFLDTRKFVQQRFQEMYSK